MFRVFARCVAVGVFVLFPLTSMAQSDASLMTYDLALEAMDAPEAYAREKGWNVTILVTDQNAHPVMLRRLNGASIRSLGSVDAAN